MKPLYVFTTGVALSLIPIKFASAQSKSQFATTAASFSRFEVESSRLAEEKAQHSATKLFASDLLREHEDALEDLADAAQKDGEVLPTTMDTEYGQKLDALKAASAAEFDQAYLSSQVSVHEGAKTQFETYINTGTSGSLRSYAENRLGTLRTYTVRVQGLTSK